jgi:hypothetical protein
MLWKMRIYGQQSKATFVANMDFALSTRAFLIAAICAPVASDCHSNSRLYVLVTVREQHCLHLNCIDTCCSSWQTFTIVNGTSTTVRASAIDLESSGFFEV